MIEWRVDLMDGTSETIKAYNVRTSPSLLEFRTTYSGASFEEWIRFPLVNVKSWRKVDGR